MPSGERHQLGSGFARLWLSDTVSTLGDGLTGTAGPLLLTRQTSDPILIAGAFTALRLPMLLFGLAGGAVVDRWDRRRLLIGAEICRGLAMAVLAASVAGGWSSVVLTYTVLLLVGLGDAITLPAGQSLVPAVVEPQDLTRANARMMSTRILGSQFIGPPLGALLFAWAAEAPFAFDALSFLLGVIPIIGLRSRHSPPAHGTPRPKVRDGLRILMAEPTLRLLALCIFLMNVTFEATFATLILYSHGRLHLGDRGYGVLVGAAGIGGIAGSLIVRRLVDRLGAPRLLWVGLFLEAFTHLWLALTHTPVVAGVVLFVFGVHATVWTVITQTLRQQRVRAEMLGRSSAAYLVFSYGGSAIGAVLGGFLVRVGTLTTPMWVGFAVVLPLVLVVGPRLGRDAPAAAASAA